MSLGPQLVTYGNVQSTFVITATLAPAATGAGVTVEQNFTVPGLQVGDQVSGVEAQFAYSSVVSFINFRVSAANTLTIALSNPTAGSLTAPTGTYYVEVNRPDPGLTMKSIQ
jgi:hypothetical protein